MVPISQRLSDSVPQKIINDFKLYIPRVTQTFLSRLKAITEKREQEERLKFKRQIEAEIKRKAIQDSLEV